MRETARTIDEGLKEGNEDVSRYFVVMKRSLTPRIKSSPVTSWLIMEARICIYVFKMVCKSFCIIGLDNEVTEDSAMLHCAQRGCRHC